MNRSHAARISLALLFAAASAAHATWSIVLIDSRTGEIGIASSTCLSNFDLKANSPVVVVGRGAAAAQSSVDTTGTNRTLIRNRLAQGVAPEAILAELAATDGSHDTRQYGIGDTYGRALSFTGIEDGAWAGGTTGSFTYTYAGQTGTMSYAIQGNVLTGPPVIDATLLAIQQTNSDLPGRLMAGMEAARSLGGDGRCSCSPANPTGCGAPPTSFTKASTCGYYIISRAGDADTGTITLATASNTPAAAADLDGDGFKELLVPASTAAAGASFQVFPNLSAFGQSVPTFGTPAQYDCVVNPTSIATGDFNRDGRVDVVVGGGSTVTNAAGSLTIYRSSAGGILSSRVELATPKRVSSVVVADMDGRNGPDLVYSTTNQVLVRLNDGTGSFGDAVAVATVTTPSSLLICDVNNDTVPDIVVGAGFNGIRYFTGRGDGTFNAQASITLAAAARGVVAADFNGDGRTDFAAILNSSAASVVVILGTPTGFATSQTLALGAIGSSLCLADINGDGRADLACLDSLRRIVTLPAAADGSFAVGNRLAGPAATGALMLADLNNDGFPEAIESTSTTLVMGNNRGIFLNSTGFAAGRYFMDINIANQTDASPEPIGQMRTAFDAWRSSLVGITDAVVSKIVEPTGTLPGKSMQMIIELRDLRGSAVATRLRSLTVARQGSGPFATVAAAPVSLGRGKYQVILTPIAVGTDRFTIIVDDGHGPVTLMPSPTVTVSALSTNRMAP
jgi:uncharacterized Ntn-hydrolase superfamily protein